MAWKAYLNYKDIAKVLGIGSSNAYKVIDSIRQIEVDYEGKKVPWCKTYEAEMIRTKKVPTSLFLQKFPHCRKALQ